MNTDYNIVINTRTTAIVGSYATIKLAEYAADNIQAETLIIGEAKHLDVFSGKQLVSLYNQCNDAPQRIAKFSDKETAIKRTWDALIGFPVTSMNDMQSELISELQRTEHATPTVVGEPQEFVPEPGNPIGEAIQGIHKVLDKAKKEPKPKKEAKPKAPRLYGHVNVPAKPMGQQKQCREGTKQAALIDALFDDAGGVTMWELLSILDNVNAKLKTWDEKAILGAMYWDVHSVKGYGVRTEERTNRWLFDHGHEATSGIESGSKPEDVQLVYFLVLPAGMTQPLEHLPRSKAE